MKINEEIFKTYDVRGTYPDQINEEIAKKIGEAYIVFSKAKTVVVGRDMRISSEGLAKNLIEGLTRQGAKVIDIGLISTPVIYYAVNALHADGAIMVTASHNPKEYNGFKFTREEGIPISSETGLKEIKKIVEGEELPEAKTKGSIETKEMTEDYINFLLSKSDPIKRMKIVVDAGNGMGGKTLPVLFRKLNLEIIPLYFELDGSFPHHEANPLKPENLVDLQNKVKETNADLGVAFDGDADRVGFVTGKGEIISGDMITALLAEEMLKEHPGAKILYDLRSSWATKEAIEQAGGIPIMSKVGHALIKAHMRKEEAVFAGELSSHYYFQDFFYCDSGVYALIKILELITDSGKTLEELIKPLQKYFSSGEMNFETKDKEKVMEAFKEKYKEAPKIFFLDGVSVEYPDWWFNVRPSGTEPLLRLKIEAKTKELLEEKKKELVEIIEK